MNKKLSWSIFICILAYFGAQAQILQPKQGANGKWGYIDEKTQQWIIEPQYIEARSFSEGFAAVSKEVGSSATWSTGVTTYSGKNFGFIDRDNNAITSFKYDGTLIGAFHDGLAAVGIYDENYIGHCGYINKTGKEIIPLIYNDTLDFCEGLACVSIEKKQIFNADSSQYYGMNAKYGFIDKAGNVVIPFKFGYAHSFNEGLAAAAVNLDVFFNDPLVINGKFGFINKDGEFVIKPQYTYAITFSEELASVRDQNHNFGCIDKNNNCIIPFKYNYISPFIDDRAVVQVLDDDGIHVGKSGVIDKTGKLIIPIQYNLIRPINDGVIYASRSIVTKKTGPDTFEGYSEYGAFDRNGNIIIPFEHYPMNQMDKFHQKVYIERIKYRTFSSYAQKYVEAEINDWQRKGRYEKTSDWQIRVTEQSRATKIKELTAIAEKNFIEERTKSISLGLNIIDYDADNEVYLIRSDEFGNILVPVPISAAESFQKSWNTTTKIPKYFINNNKVALSECTFKTPSGQTYKYSNQASLNYTIAQVEYNFDPVDINVSTAGTQGKQNILSQTVSVGKSDIDVNIPETSTNNNMTFAVIIANEEYKKEAPVLFALNDGRLFREYCEKTLGIPVNQIHLVENATLNDIRAEIDWIKKVADAYKREANIIFYYAGHGIPDLNSKAAYLLPSDGYGSDIATGYQLNTLYSMLGSLPIKSATVFLDACFSGAQRDGHMLVSLRGRGVAIKVDDSRPSGNVVVFSAVSNDEIAYPYMQKGHGLFTYFLLKKLKETKGNVTFGELSNYIATNVKQQSIVENSKSQTPTVLSSSILADKWTGIKLK